MPDRFDIFRFLDLPAELRLTVYEYLPNRTKRVTFTHASRHGHTSTFSLITNSTPSTAILATCRLINGEAKAVLRATAQRFLEGGPDGGPAPRIEADIDALVVLTRHDGLLQRVMMICDTLENKKRQQPRRSTRASIVKDLASSIMAKGYHLESGSAIRELQELEDFVKMAANALRHQQLSRTRSAQIQIALHKRSDDEDMHFIRALQICVLNLTEASMLRSVHYVMHLLNDYATSVDDQKNVFDLMSECIDAQAQGYGVFLGQNSFNESNKEVYDTLWKSGG